MAAPCWSPYRSTTAIRYYFEQFTYTLNYLIFYKKMHVIKAFLSKMSAGECCWQHVQRIFNGVDHNELLREAREHKGVHLIYKDFKYRIIEGGFTTEEAFKNCDQNINIPYYDVDDLPTNYRRAVAMVLNYRPPDRRSVHTGIISVQAANVLENICRGPPPVYQVVVTLTKRVMEAAMLAAGTKNNLLDPEPDVMRGLMVARDVFFELCFVSAFESENENLLQIYLNLFNREPFDSNSEATIFKVKSLHLDCKERNMEAKVSQLRYILDRNKDSCSSKEIPTIEHLLEDILSTLPLADATRLLDLPCPLLRGDILRKYLDEGMPLLELVTPSVPAALTAITHCICSTPIIDVQPLNLPQHNYSIQKSSKLSNITVINQKNMFAAAEKGNLEELKRIINAGADMEGVDINSRTVLHYAAKGGSRGVVQYLLSHQVHPLTPDFIGQTPLHVAAANGQFSVLEHFLLERPPIHLVDNDKRTVLHLAAQSGHLDTVKLLLRHHADKRARDKKTLTPLHYAVKSNHRSVVEALLDPQEHVDGDKTVEGKTSLMMAAECGYVKLTRYLLSKKADVNHTNDIGATALLMAAENGHSDVVKTLLSNGADVNAAGLDDFSPLHLAARVGREDVVLILLEHKARIHKTQRNTRMTALHCAAQGGFTRVAALLIQHGAAVGPETLDGLGPIHLAAYNGYFDIVSLLVDSKASVLRADSSGNTALHFAACGDHIDIIGYLLEKGCGLEATDRKKRTPLLSAAMCGKMKAVEFLIKKGANIGAQDIHCRTALHLGINYPAPEVVRVLLKHGASVNLKAKVEQLPIHLALVVANQEIVEMLLQANTDVNSKDGDGNTPLHLAASEASAKIVHDLVRAGADLTAITKDGLTPLHMAATTGNEETFKALMKEGADVHAKTREENTALSIAVLNNSVGIVEALLEQDWLFGSEEGKSRRMLKNKVRINTSVADGNTPLHLAAKTGNIRLVRRLLEKGADISAATPGKLQPLHMAVLGGHTEVVAYLLDKGAEVDAVGCEDLTSLQMIARKGTPIMARVLVARGARNRKTTQNTPLGLACGHGHLEVVKAIIENDPERINCAESSNGTALHIATKHGHLQLCKYLVGAGYSVHCTNSLGSQPIHVAASEGYSVILEYYLNNGAAVEDRGTAEQTCLHYAAIYDRVPIATYLIKHGADVNAKDRNGLTPLHMAATLRHTNFIKVILSLGAHFDSTDIENKRPSELTGEVETILSLTEQMYWAVERGEAEEVECCLLAGASVDACSVTQLSALHLACQASDLLTLRVLIKHKAMLSPKGPDNNTPLHYACMVANFDMVQCMLSHGAQYNPTNVQNKTPLDCTEDADIIELLETVDRIFNYIKQDNEKAIEDLIDTTKKYNTGEKVFRKLIMNVRNSGSKTILAFAVLNEYTLEKKLREALQGDLTADMLLVDSLVAANKYQEAYEMTSDILQHSREALGAECPATWVLEKKVASVLYKALNFSQALSIYKGVLEKQIKAIADDDQEILDTWGMAALTLHRLGNHHDALPIFQENYTKQCSVLGSNHTATIATLMHAGLVLEKLTLYKEALEAFNEVLVKKTAIFGINHTVTLSVRCNIAIVYMNQGRYVESQQILESVYKVRKAQLGPNNSDTLKTLYNLGILLVKQGRLEEATLTLRDLLNRQALALGDGHMDTLNTQNTLGQVFFDKGNWIAALKHFKDSYDKRKAILGAKSSEILTTKKNMELITVRLRAEGVINLNDFDPIDANIHVAASAGNISVVRDLLECGAGVNFRDCEGRTALHYAVNKSHYDLVAFLLEQGADPTAHTQMGNTPLHTAATKGEEELTETLLKRVKENWNTHLSSFLEAKTTSKQTTALHAAAKCGSLPVVKCLLKYGAVYNVKNLRNETPLKLATDKDVIRLLGLVQQLFDDIKGGSSETMKRLETLDPEEIAAVINARNTKDQTPVQIAFSSGHKDLARQLIQKLKEIK